MGQWRYADEGVCHRDEEAIARALASHGKRNLFHDDRLLVLEYEDTPSERRPPAERRLILTLASPDWLGGASSAGGEQRIWRSDPMPLPADGRPTADAPQSEAPLPAAVCTFFSQVHEDLHGGTHTTCDAPAKEAARRGRIESEPPAGAPGRLPDGWSPAGGPAAPPWRVALASRDTVTSRPRRRRSILIAMLVAGLAFIVVGVSQGFWQASGQASSWASSSGASRPSATDVSAIAAAVDPCLVDISTSLAYERAQVTGTGIVLSASGEVLTNNHVIDGASSISVTDLGNGFRYQANVVGYDRGLDIAVLQLSGASGLRTIRLGDSSKLTIGEGVVAIGNAGGLGGTPIAAAGSIVALDQHVVAANQGNGSSEQLSGLIGVDAAVQPGDSGGPLVDLSGRAIGVDTAASADFSLSSSSSRGFAIPIAQALSIENGESSAGVHIGPTAYLGVELALLRSETALQAAQTRTGATVSEVFPGSPAQQAGLESGDLITSLAGQPVGSATALASVLDGRRPAEQVSLGWIDPSGQRHAAEVQLGVGPPA